MEVPEDLLLYKIPSDYRPGEDRLSKLVLSKQEIVDPIAHYLLNVASEIYTTDSTEWPNGTRSDVVYVPQHCISDAFPPILIEVQKRVDRDFMSRLITYAINLYERYKVYPKVLIFSVDAVCQHVMHMFHPSKQKADLLETSCHFWASSCYLTSNKIIQPLIDECEDVATISPVAAIQHFLGGKQRNMMALACYDHPIIIQLYTIAKDETEKYLDASKSQLKALSTICDTSENQFDKLIQLIQKELPDNSKAMKYLKQGKDYHARLKRKYEDVLSGIDVEEESVTPMQEPEPVILVQSKTQEALQQEEIDFIKAFITKRVGRMNWRICYEEGTQLGYFKKYGNSNSLRVIYSRFKNK